MNINLIWYSVRTCSNLSNYSKIVEIISYSSSISDWTVSNSRWAPSKKTQHFVKLFPTVIGGVEQSYVDRQQ